MLILGSRLKDAAVMSLQTGTRLARIGRPIIDPANLKIIAYEVEGPLLAEKPSFLRTNDIREVGSVGMIIDSNDELIGQHDVIRIDELHKLGFNLIGLQVLDEDKHRLGKIDDYAIETDNFVIQQLDVKRGILKGLTDVGLLVHRSQIVEINDRAVIVKSMKKKRPEPVKQAIRHDYVNPFRGTAPDPTPET